MSDTAKQSPLGVNALSSLLQNNGLCLNPPTVEKVGTSHDSSSYSYGSVCQDTCLRLATYSINYAFVRNLVTTETYNNIISIGAGTVPALGNSKAPTFTWAGPADTGDSRSTFAQTVSWIPYTKSNQAPVITSWGYTRLFALQAWDEFNYNNTLNAQGQYRDFLGSFSNAYSFIEYSNTAILATDNSKTYLDGVYSNMDDLISADITGVNLATGAFGLDLINLGNALDLSTIDSFGLPSKLLLTLQKYNAITPSLTLALGSILESAEISSILDGVTPTALQESNIYQAFTIIVGIDLADILVPLNCRTIGLTSLANLLDPKYLFPNSRGALTVPITNTTQSSVNSKIYFKIYSSAASNAGVTFDLTTPSTKAAVGTIVPPGIPSTTPPITPSDTFAPQLQPTGFDSYLVGILPNDVAIAAGAFSVSMLQIKNITSIPIEKLAQVVNNLETTVGLNLVAGSSVPVNTPLADTATSLIALGTGPQGTYTTSDFFGCMSGLPYPWSAFGSDRGIKTMINNLETTKLYNIYHEMYLATTWQPASTTVQQKWVYEIVVPYVAPIGISVGTFVPGQVYTVGPDLGTDFTLLGAPNNTPGTTFMATGSGDFNSLSITSDLNYTITDLGDTDWNAVAGTTGVTYSVGSTITAVAAAPGTGSAIQGSSSAVDWSTGVQEEYDWFYQLSFQLADTGGGYSRGTATIPKVTITPNNVKASAISFIEPDDRYAASAAAGGGTFGRLTKLVVNNGSRYKFAHSVQNNYPGPPNVPPRPDMPEEKVSIEAPPVDSLPVTGSGISTGGKNVPGLVYSYLGLVSSGTQGWTEPMNNVVQQYIGQANNEILSIKSARGPDTDYLNKLWDITGTQLTIEQKARALLYIPVPVPRNLYMSMFPMTQYTFVDAIATYALNTSPNMSAQTLEAISNLSTIGGQSIVGVMRESRNKTRLSYVGVSLDNNIPSSLSGESISALIANGTLPTAQPGSGININGVEYTIPATLVQVDSTGTLVQPEPIGSYNPDTNTYTTTVPIETFDLGIYPGVPVVPVDPAVSVDPSGPGNPSALGSLAGSPYNSLIRPNLNNTYSSGVLIPGTMTVSQAIDQVTLNNCNCWS